MKFHQEIAKLRAFAKGQDSAVKRFDLLEIADGIEEAFKQFAEPKTNLSSCSITERPDPTAETLQEAAAAITPAPLNADDIEWGEKEARAIAAEMDAEEIAENGYAYADAPVTIGSYSDVSDEDVRAAGGVVLGAKEVVGHDDMPDGSRAYIYSDGSRSEPRP